MKKNFCNATLPELITFNINNALTNFLKMLQKQKMPVVEQKKNKKCNLKPRQNSLEKSDSVANSAKSMFIQTPRIALK